MFVPVFVDEPPTWTVQVASIPYLRNLIKCVGLVAGHLNGPRRRLLIQGTALNPETFRERLGMTPR